MSMNPRVPAVPASFFGMVLGLAGLGGAWRVAHQAWGVPAWVGEALMAVAALVWAILIALYVYKWIARRADAIAEAKQPIQCCFIGLVGVATLLIGGAALPYSRPLALGLFGIGALYPEWQAYFVKHQPPTLVTWGQGDRIFLVEGARAYARDLKDCELHLLDTGHFALEEEHAAVAAHITSFMRSRGIL